MEVPPSIHICANSECVHISIDLMTAVHYSLCSHSTWASRFLTLLLRVSEPESALQDLRYVHNFKYF